MNAKIKQFVPHLLDWYVANARDLPWRRTRDSYAIWVSEIMLQQTQVKTVIPFWERWMRELPTIEAAAKVPAGKLHKLWEGLGYYTRVRNLQKAAHVIVQQHGGKFPETFDAVLALPGIGRYTAGAICSIAFNQPTPILDGNVIRVLTRVFGMAENPREKSTSQKLWRLAEELVVYASTSHTPGAGKETNADRCSHLNQALMELGALVCTPRNAQCRICPLNQLCVAYREQRLEELPNLGRREPATARRFAAFVVERDGKLLVRQRPAGVVNAQLWEFPNGELTGAGPEASDSLAAVAKQVCGFAVQNISPLVTVKHSITRYRITLEAYTADVGRSGRNRFAGTASPAGAVWKTPAQMQSLAFTSAHRRLLRAARPAGAI